MFYAAIWFRHTWFPDICERSSFLTFWWVLLLVDGGGECVSVVDNVNKVSLCSGIFFSRFRTKNTHTMNHAPTKPHLATCQPIVGFCQAMQICFHLKSFSLRLWCKGQWEATASSHRGTNFGSKVRDSPVTLICWPLKKPLRPVFPRGFLLLPRLGSLLKDLCVKLLSETL